MVSDSQGTENEPAGSLNERAYGTLLDDILEGRLAPGAPVDRKALAERLGMSVAPVHMAVNQMEADGLVVTLPRRGTHVRVYKPEDIRGHRVVRVALEGQAARIYAGEVISMQRGTLRPLAQKVQKSKPANMERIRAEIEFHHALVALADVPMLTRFFDRVMTIGLFMTSSGIMPVEEKPRDNHVRLIDDLCEASPVQAEKRIRKHILQKG